MVDYEKMEKKKRPDPRMRLLQDCSPNCPAHLNKQMHEFDSDFSRSYSKNENLVIQPNSVFLTKDGAIAQHSQVFSRKTTQNVRADVIPNILSLDTG